MFAIPTTLSAGEFTYFVGITDEDRKVKDLYVDRRITAKAVILDPELTMETPERLWLGTGMRAVDHCIEAMCSSTAQPFIDALAYRALNMLVRYLRETRADPGDAAARGQCMVAAWMSVCGLANVTLGLSHGIGHQLGARCNVPHGETSAVMMPHVMAFNRDVTTATRQAWVAEAMGVDIAGMSEVGGRHRRRRRGGDAGEGTTWACRGGSAMWASRTTTSPASPRTRSRTSSSPAIRAR